ncbi:MULTISPECIES: CocE/NonD family hydrolase [Nocardiaceae]|uniref:CocE/NonD family hydrolase n=1 Tax=Rhodococcoides corynebacterioides TaxID=53972 RepID=A0ABS2L0X6_9NOCA|nr:MULTISPECIES: CocE/NonD family hydrolase [Rhodococcus]MBM7417211.1 putative CocE/NonD family hydrolase [Rhodococcus corynebacterioides]MBP1115464.1 putative CocE/NonD family hydrolase [Rhodococcus sp. PvP016]
MGARVRRRSTVISGVLVALLVASGAAVPATADPTGGADAVAWTAAADAPPHYPRVAIDWDVPITMSDGTVLQANIYRPADASGRPVETDLPTVLNITPYTKLVGNLIDSIQQIPGVSEPVLDFLASLNFAGTPFDGITDLTQAVDGGGLRIFAVNRNLVQNGYAQVVVDARGTGFSQGSWDVLGPREQQDSAEIIDWTSRQSWSDGQVGMSGISYSAINSVQAAALRPPALKAIFPVEPGNDLLRDIVGTGGALGVGFMPLWLTLVNVLKFVPNVQSILQGQFDTRWLADRLQDPAILIPELANAFTAPTIADIRPETLGVAQDGEFYADRSADLSQIEVPTMVYGGWHDIFTNSEPRIYNDIPVEPGRKQLIMGDGYHVNPGAGFGRPGNPPRLDALERAWFDHWLKGVDNGVEKYGPVTLFQQGGGWTTTDQFPRAGAQSQRTYLSAAPSGTAGHSLHDGTLSATPTADTARLTVAPGLRGVCSRDAAVGTAGAAAILGSVCTKDSRFTEAEALTFTSAPAEKPTQISGATNLHLNTVLDRPDGFWAATMNDVAPDGTSTPISHGALTASLRRIDETKSTRSLNGDYIDAKPALTLASRQPLVPGVPTTVDINLLPTDAVIAPGHRIRIDVYAASVPRYLPLGPMLVDSALAPQHVQLDPANPSFVNIPYVN